MNMGSISKSDKCANNLRLALKFLSYIPFQEVTKVSQKLEISIIFCTSAQPTS